MASRSYDIVLWGCTGYTGELVADYLAAYQGKHSELKWALAGRSEAKVAALKRRLQAEFPGCDPPILIGTADDQSSVDAVVAQTRVIITTAGPYLKRGTPVVDACVRLRTDYVDITGEAAWVAELIEKYHSIAEKNGTHIVPMSGYDSIPSDLGTLFAVNAVRETFGTSTCRVRAIAEMNGQLSGGTLATGIEMARDFPEYVVKSRDPFAMGGNVGAARPEDEDVLDAVYDADLDTWTQPFQMQSINTRVVRRSNAWLHYGHGFQYQELGKVGLRLQV
jgi:short subunit dehydrogenase-like uncharacterized protein